MQTCESFSPDKNMFQNSFLSYLSITPASAAVQHGFSLLFNPPVCLPLRLFPTTVKLRLVRRQVVCVHAAYYTSVCLHFPASQRSALYFILFTDVLLN